MNQSFEMNIGESGHFDAKKRFSVRLKFGTIEWFVIVASKPYSE